MRKDKKQYEAPKLEMLLASIGMSIVASPTDNPIDDPWIRL